ncbi:DNA-binding protein [Sesbania bispinosa]|nr:DNA-binding protein [Sesbania bispinosa]KAJ1383541.1 DNA-binding protein [Sesbania bispinosa]
MELRQVPIKKAQNALTLSTQESKLLKGMSLMIPSTTMSPRTQVMMFLKLHNQFTLVQILSLSPGVL